MADINTDYRSLDSGNMDAVNSAAAKSLSDYLGKQTGQGDGTDTIMSQYNDARTRQEGATASQNKATGLDYQNQIGDTNESNAIEQQNAAESGAGDNHNSVALRYLVDTGDKRVRDLMKQRDELILQNNAAGAEKLNSLLVNEQQLVTTARQNFAQNLLNLAGLSTPGQTTAREIAKSGATGATAANQAQAAAAQAQAEQTRTLTGFINGSGGSATIPDTDPDVQGLMNGTITPEQLNAKYSGLPGGFGGAKAAAILSKAQSLGYNVNNGTLSGLGQKTSTEAANSGNPLSSGFAGLRSLFQNNNPLAPSLFSPAKSKATPTSGATSGGVGWKVIKK